MKKIILFLIPLIILTGCGNMEIGNTPSKKVEDYLNKYQTLDKNVLEDLDNTLTGDATLTDAERKEYRDFMKKHYQDMKYEIKDETIDGDNATVIVEVTVRDYSGTVSSADAYRNANPDQFDGDNDALSFSSYRLDELKKVTDTVTYTINFTLLKRDDKWVLDQLSNEDLNKINGLYAG